MYCLIVSHQWSFLFIGVYLHLQNTSLKLEITKYYIHTFTSTFCYQILYSFVSWIQVLKPKLTLIASESELATVLESTSVLDSEFKLLLVSELIPMAVLSVSKFKWFSTSIEPFMMEAIVSRAFLKLSCCTFLSSPQGAFSNVAHLDLSPGCSWKKPK